MTYKEPVLEPDVFIIESVSFEDEEEGYFEGEALGTGLRMCRKNPIYYRIRTRRELEEVAQIFKESNYRFLHLSTHGSADGFSLTLDHVTYDDFGLIFEKTLALRRLFVSACQAGKQSFVETVAATNRGMHSVLSPCNDIGFSTSVAFWMSFYVAAFARSGRTMKASDLEPIVQQAVNLFAEPFHWAVYRPNPPESWDHRKIVPQVP